MCALRAQTEYGNYGIANNFDYRYDSCILLISYLLFNIAIKFAFQKHYIDKITINSYCNKRTPNISAALTAPLCEFYLDISGN